MKDTTLAPVSAGVRAAIAAYTRAQDAGDSDALVDLYIPDGVLEVSGFEAIVGHDALRAAFSSWAPTKPQLHLVANTQLTAWSDDRATAVSDVAFLQRGQDAWSLRIVGRYDDRLVRTGQTWRFARRVSIFSS